MKNRQMERLKTASNRVVGTKQTARAVESGQAALVFLAEDADDYIKRRIRQLCEDHGVSIERVDTMKELGEMCGIQVGAATAAVLK
jgi:large subunit ribosomal protein L7A